MKLKASPRGRKVVVEFESQESELPPIALPEIALKKILVPIDFSPLSRKAAHYAVSFARQFGGEVFLLHVVEIIPAPEMIVVEGEFLNVRLREQAVKGLAEWKRELEHVPVQTSVRDGTPFRVIVEVANETNADLIVLGTQGRTGLSHFFIGSTAERVVRHAPCPVMVVRGREHDFLNEKKTRNAKSVARTAKRARQR